MDRKLSGELDYRIRYDVEHDLFHAQNVFNDEYIKPTFIEYVQKLEKEKAELKEKLEHRNCLDCSNYHINIKLIKAKALLVKWVELYKPKSETALPTPIQVDTEQFLKGEADESKN